MRIDLHTHSTASDGTDSPAALIGAAARAGLTAVALTDHDTTAGWDAAVAARPAGLTLVRGMEMSCTGEGEDGHPVDVHLLAYLFDPADPAFAAERERLRAERVRRLRAMAERMVADGLPIDPDAVLAGTAVAGRPHLAKALVAAGLAADVDDAFRRYLYTGGPYYLPKTDTQLDRAVSMIAAAGGASVLAHGRARSRGRVLSIGHIRRLAAAGLCGLEIAHPDHTAADRAVLIDLAAELNLVRTGASDYHGTNKTVTLGQCTTEPDEFDALVAKASGVPVLSGPGA